MDTFAWKIDQFDSEIFNIKTAKIDHVTSESVGELVRNLKLEKIEYAVIRIKANDFKLIHALEAHGFYLVDGFVEMEHELLSKKTVNNNIVSAEVSDLDGLKKVASTSFRVTRFYNDEFLSKKNPGRVYEEWIENSLNKKAADEVLLYKENSRVVGFVTIKKDGHIPLIAVDENFQGKGIAKKLIEKSLEILCSWGVKKAKIETQIQNIPAFRAYTSCGFKVVDSFVTFSWRLE